MEEPSGEGNGDLSRTVIRVVENVGRSEREKAVETVRWVSLGLELNCGVRGGLYVAGTCEGGRKRGESRELGELRTYVQRLLNRQ